LKIFNIYHLNLKIDSKRKLIESHSIQQLSHLNYFPPPNSTTTINDNHALTFRNFKLVRIVFSLDFYTHRPVYIHATLSISLYYFKELSSLIFPLDFLLNLVFDPLFFFTLLILSISFSFTMNTSFSFNGENDDHEDLLTLSLSIGARSPATVPLNQFHSYLSSAISPLAPLQPTFTTTALPLPPLPLSPQEPRFWAAPPPQPPSTNLETAPIPCRGRAGRKPSIQALKQGKSEAVSAPYPWATTRRATVHSLDYLLSKGINVISGNLYCKRCDKQYEVEYDLRQKFMEVACFVSKNKCGMHDRAPAIWMNPSLPNCEFCDQNNYVRPAVSKKRSINWLFLLLGQMLGCCKLSELKYFCKHTKNHRTGAKDRVLYLTYLALCKQLDPNGAIDL